MLLMTVSDKEHCQKVADTAPAGARGAVLDSNSVLWFAFRGELLGASQGLFPFNKQEIYGRYLWI